MPERERQPTRFAELPTVGGYLAGEVASALQKSIRRGEERDALHWATELELSGLGKYVWKRLRIIASEDVGLAEPLAAVMVRALYENWLEEVKQQKGDTRYAGFHRVYLLHAVCLLARARKSRMLDDALAVMYAGDRTAEHPEIPDYALDRHTARGARMGGGMEHFVDVGSKIENEAADVENPYRDEARELLVPRSRRPVADESDVDEPDEGQLTIE
jgi:replication-associated recombination protein RarA